MKKELSKQEENLTLGVLAIICIVVIAQLTLIAKIFKLVSRGNKALKIYINKNKYYEKFNNNDFKVENSNEDIPF